MFSVDRQSFQSLSALALFTFAFLGSEFFFDSRIGLLISAEGVVGAQAMILGASVVGFLAYAPISKLAGGTTRASGGRGRRGYCGPGHDCRCGKRTCDANRRLYRVLPAGEPWG